MRCDPELHPTDVLPESADGETIDRSTLAGSDQHWGDELPESTFGVRGLFPRMTRMVVTRCHDEAGRFVGLLWRHARTDTDGAEDHEVYVPVLPAGSRVTDAADMIERYNLQGRHMWVASSEDPITLIQELECPCGQKGVIREGAWLPVVPATLP